MEQDLPPGASETVTRIGRTTGEPGHDRRDRFRRLQVDSRGMAARIESGPLRRPVEPHHDQFVPPHRDGVRGNPEAHGLDRFRGYGEPDRSGGKLGFRIGQSAQHFERVRRHGVTGSGQRDQLAVVADGGGAELSGQLAGVEIGGEEERPVGEDPRSVVSLPVELPIRVLRFGLPWDGTGDEAVEAGTQEDLRQRPCGAPCARRPRDAGPLSERSLEFLLPVQRLADQGFSTGKAQVRSDPPAGDSRRDDQVQRIGPSGPDVAGRPRSDRIHGAGRIPVGGSGPPCATEQQSYQGQDGGGRPDSGTGAKSDEPGSTHSNPDSRPVVCRAAVRGRSNGRNVPTAVLWRRPRPQVILRFVSTESYGPRLAELRRRLVPAQGQPPAMHEVVAPFTGAPLGRLPPCGEAEVAVAMSRARLAAAAWTRIPPARRSESLKRFHDLVLQRQDEVLDIVQLETGKARSHAFEEVADAAIVSRYYAVRAPRLLARRRRRGAVPGLTRVTEIRKPKGVVGIIAPWNYPLSLGVADTVPALLAGNAVILKPDLQTTHTALWIAELLADAGLPEHLFQVVSGDGAAAGSALVDAVDYVSFTGSTETGRIVAARAGERLTAVCLELGGKNPMIVRADADLERAVDGALRGAFANAGQLCMSIERVYVHWDLFDAFLSRFVDRVARLRLGSGLDWGADLGCLTSASQLARVSRHVEDAVSKGVTVRTGGRPRPEIGPYFFEPTVLTGVTPEMIVYSDETFGPVVAVRPFDTDDEAVSLANDSRFGLNASVWSRDAGAARALAVRLEAGSVNLNEAYAATWASIDAPMGGVKDSGFGRRHGIEGLFKFTDTQTVAEQRLVPISLSESWTGRPGARRVATSVLRAMRRIPGLR